MKTVKKQFEIKISDNGSVYLSTTVGNGNLGGGFIKFSDSPTILAKGLLSNFMVGNKNSLASKTLVVTTTGLDVNDSTNHIPVIHTFAGAVNPSKNVLLGEEAEEDGVVQFIVEYTFN